MDGLGKKGDFHPFLNGAGHVSHCLFCETPKRHILIEEIELYFIWKIVGAFYRSTEMNIQRHGS